MRDDEVLDELLAHGSVRERPVAAPAAVEQPAEGGPTAKVSRRPKRRKDSAMLSQAQIDRARPGIERSFAWVLLALSFTGAVAALHARPPDFDGVRPLLQGQIDPVLVAAGVGLQGGCTLIQWLYRKRRSWLRAAALTVDAVSTAIGYAPLALPMIATALALVASADTASWGAWIVLVVASFVLAFIPESVLID